MTSAITPSLILDRPVTPRLADRGSPTAAFADALRGASSADAGDASRETLRGAASELVSSALLLPVFQSLREGPFADGPFAPGPAERRFMPLLDQQLADRVVAAARFDLVDVIVDRLASRGAAS